MNVLIVDDQIHIVDGIIDGVNWDSLGVGRCFTAYSGSIALQILQSEDIDLLITDIEMPGMDGLSLAKEAVSADKDILEEKDFADKYVHASDSIDEFIIFVDSLLEAGRYAITGLVYRHNKMGALPIGHRSLMNLEKLNVQEEVSDNYDFRLHVYPTKGMNYSVLSDREKTILDIVIKKFKNYKAQKIVDYMHEEKAYQRTNPGEIIPFSMANDIRDFQV